jgi:hypothetical protein
MGIAEFIIGRALARPVGSTHPAHSRGAQLVNRKPKYHRLKQMYGTDERPCNGPIGLPVIGLARRRRAVRTEIVEAKMRSKAYLDTAQTILRAAQTMTDQYVAGQLKALAEDYERRAEKAAHADAAKALARSAACECEALS